jgi:hypothetical protein
MGMLMHRHRVEQMKAEGEAGEAKPKPRRKRDRKAKPVETHNPPAAPEAELGDAPTWSELTDDQVVDAYVTNVGGDAEDRDAMVAALEALDADGTVQEPAEGTSADPDAEPDTDQD